MNEMRRRGGLVDVRMRYRPVGDVLTISVRGIEDSDQRSQTEIDDETLMEWMPMPDGSRSLLALQILGARSRLFSGSQADLIPDALRNTVRNLIDPGRQHHHHPSSHRPISATATHEITVATTSSDLQLDAAW